MGSKAAVAAGLGCAGLAQLIALMLAGAGHGWIAPFFWSPLLFLVYPITFLRWLGVGPPSPAIDGGLVVVAAAADCLLIASSYANEGPYLRAIFAAFAPALLAWIGLWAFWQVLALRILWQTLARRRAERVENGTRS